MGSFQQSFLIRRADPVAVEALLGRWLAAKGFMRTDETLFECDPVSERGVFLLSNADWTVLLYSHWNESDRLVFELHKLQRPFLRFQVHDSDIWAYKLFAAGNQIAAFNSNPRYFGQFDDSEGDVHGDPEAICRICELPGLEKTLARKQRNRSLFKEWSLQQFCAVLDATPAGYDYQTMATEDAGTLTGGFDVRELRYSRTSGTGGAVVLDLHAVRLSKLEWAPPAAADGTSQLPPEVLEQIRRSQRSVLIFTYALRPIFWILRLLIWICFTGFRALGAVKKALGRTAPAVVPMLGSGKYRLDGRRLVSDRFGCSVTLPEDVTAAPYIATPNPVFGFNVGEITVSCNACPPDRLTWLEWPPPMPLAAAGLEFGTTLGTMGPVQVSGGKYVVRGDVVRDEKYAIAEFPARMLVEEFPGTGETPSRFHGMHLVQTHRAMFCFSYYANGRVSEQTEQQISGIVRTLVLAAEPLEQAERGCGKMAELGGGNMGAPKLQS